MTLDYLTVEHLTTKDLTKIFSRIEIHPDLSWNGTPCWHWHGSRAVMGYGHTHIANVKTIRVHRLLFAWLIHSIPVGQKYGELDHLCRRPSCCNPLHLEFVSHKTNTLRGVSPSSENAQKTHCKRGHPLSGDNLILAAKGRRGCRTCDRANRKIVNQTEARKIYQHNWYLAKKAKRLNDGYH